MKHAEIARKTTAEIKHFQEEKLQEMLRYVSENSPYYKRMFAGHNILLSEIKTLEDLVQLPLTTKDELQKYNDDFFCVPKSKIVDFVTTSGTLGAPVTVGLTDGDLDRLANNEAHALACSGITENDTVQLMTTIDRRFMAGLAYFLGVRKLGAGIIRVGSGVPELQWDSILKFEPTYLICVPSFLLKMIQYAENNQIDLASTSVKAAICIGEPIREQDFTLNTLGKKIVTDWKIALFSTYASTEMATAFNECEQHQGGHLQPELIIAEILDEKNRPVSRGELGELVITTLGIEAMPLLRFKTGDMVKAHDEPCECGRNTLRLGPVMGRKQQMIKYKGTTLYPPGMQSLLEDFDSLKSYVIELFHNEIGTDEIVLKIATHAPSETLKTEIQEHFRAKLRVSPTIEFASEAEIDKIRFPKLSRKPLWFIDKR